MEIRFLGEGEARRCLTLFRPATPARGALLFVPPFAEEMNKSRAQVAVTARRLAAAGYAVAVPDLHGTGDSAGDFGDATWQGWVADVTTWGRWWAQECGAPLGLWALRTGALLAAQSAPDLSLPLGLWLWQPVQQGKTFLIQFLRLRLAADLVGAGGGPQATVENLRTALARGESLDIAGYRLAPALAHGLEAAEFAPPPGVATHVFQVAARDGLAPSPALAEAMRRWAATGHAVSIRVVRGPSFWQTVEIEFNPELTAALLAELAGAGG